MQTIKITETFAATLDFVRLAGKTPWVIINEDYAVDVFEGRNLARAAKAAGLAGKILKADEVEFVVLGEFKGMNTRRCPKCGSSTEMYVGRNVKGLVVDEDRIIGCHHCDWEYEEPKAAKSQPTKSIPHTNESTVDKPCKLVWQIASEMKGARRKDIIAACVAKGVAFYTARTQYQLYLAALKEEQEREAAMAAKAKK